MQKTIERYGIGICLGAVVTIGLLWVMQAVISSDKNPLNENAIVANLDFVRVTEDRPPDRIKREAKKKPEVRIRPPEARQEQVDHDFDGLGTELSLDTAIEITGFDAGGYMSDGEYLPISKVEPIYPPRALQRGIEGHVIVSFTVTEQGSVEDVSVVESEPVGWFDRAAKNAALKFKYRPTIIDGKAVRVTGVKNKIIFAIDNND